MEGGGCQRGPWYVTPTLSSWALAEPLSLWAWQPLEQSQGREVGRKWKPEKPGTVFSLAEQRGEGCSGNTCPPPWPEWTSRRELDQSALS